MSILFVLAQAAAASAPAVAPPAEQQGVSSYPASFFAAMNASNAQDMVSRIPGFTLDSKILLMMAAFKAHAALNFWRGQELGDGTPKAGAMGQFGRLTSIGDLPPDRELDSLIGEAAEGPSAGAVARHGKRRVLCETFRHMTRPSARSLWKLSSRCWVARSASLGTIRKWGSPRGNPGTHFTPSIRANGGGRDISSARNRSSRARKSRIADIPPRSTRYPTATCMSW